MERIERIKNEEEERKGNEVEALSNRDRDHSLHRSLFGVLRMTVS